MLAEFMVKKFMVKKLMMKEVLGEEVHGEEVLGEEVLEAWCPRGAVRQVLEAWCRRVQFHVKIVTTTEPEKECQMRAKTTPKIIPNTRGNYGQFSNFDFLNMLNYFCIKIISILKANT